MTIEELKHLKESEDKIEFKKAKNQYAYASSKKSVLGYVVALANEGGGILAFGIEDKYPHTICGSVAYEGREGQLEQDVYRDLSIRVETEILYEEDRRVLVVKVPSRPIGKPLYFNDIALMRVGDGLSRMSEVLYLKIIQEQEPDFSAKICPNLTIDDIDNEAAAIFKEKYAIKQNNESFKSLNAEQAMRDVGLITDNGITYAALILLGTQQAIKEYIPNAQVNIEYRQSLTQIHFDKREVFIKPLFVAIDEIWDYLNLRNIDNKISEGPYKFDLPYFNEEVIREAVLNAIAHRDYTITSEIVIKQYTDRITILNPGGFPKGVTKDNLITVSSTPRSRLLTEILEKTGLVERSGQGVDKIYRITLSEGKAWPDYSKTDFYQVELSINGKVIDNAFAIFIKEIQDSRGKFDKLGVFEVITLEKVRSGISDNLDNEILNNLINQGLIKKVGKTTSKIFSLSDSYYEIAQVENEIAGYRTIDIMLIAKAFKENEYMSMKRFTEVFESKLKRTQVRYLVEKLVADNILSIEGEGKSTKYKLNFNKEENQSYYDLIKSKLIG